MGQLCKHFSHNYYSQPSNVYLLLLQAPSISYDFIGYDTDPSDHYPQHGTNCGGIIGALKDNVTCGVGIAHEANLGGKLI